MLNFAKTLIRASLSRPSSPPTVATKLECEFFVLDGTSWQSLAEGKCEITFIAGAKGRWAMQFECPKESLSESIALDSVSNMVRFSDDETGAPCFQWIVRKGRSGDDLEEFGVRFTTEQAANEFATNVASYGQKSADVIFEVSDGDISLIEQSSLKWETIENHVVVRVSKTNSGREEVYLTVLNGSTPETVLFHSVVSPALQIEFVGAATPSPSNLVTFLGFSPMEEDVRVLGLLFGSESSFREFQKVVHPEPEFKKKKPNLAAPSINEDVVMWEDPIGVRSAESAPVIRSRRRPKENQTADHLDSSEQYENVHLETGRTSQRAIVFAKRKDGSKSTSGQAVFRVYQPTTGGSSLEAISSYQTFSTGALLPTQVMVHENDSKVLMLDPNSGKDKIFELDLARGQVISEWTPGMGMSVNSILPISSESQGTGEKTFLGINEKAVFVMDPRANTSDIFGNRVASFNYASNVKLACAATDQAGHIATASKTGQIRLFDGQTNRDGDLKKAKTLLSLTCDGISHVSVTADGEWLLATCATYLLLINTTAEGYSKSISRKIVEESEPISLSLDWKDVTKYGLKTIAFTPARFDETKDLIVTSTGSLAVLWDFGKIKKTGTVSYSVKPMQDFIIDTHVLGGAVSKGGNPSVVAMYSDKVDLASATRTNKRGGN